jgi:replicative DNA helicase
VAGAEVKRLPMAPHSVEAEQALLGALMLDARAWARIAARVSAADFYRADHRLIFAAISALSENASPTDAVSVIAQLERKGDLEASGGRAYVAQLYAGIPSASNVEAYAKIVRERSMLRRLRETGGQITALVDEAGENGADTLVADAIDRLLGLQAGSRIGRGLVESRALVSELIDDLDRRRAGATGLAIGLADFDRLSYGLEPGDLVVIAGRPGMGKTTLIVSIGAHVSRDTGVAIFSAEMTSQQLMRRCVAMLGNIPQGRLRRAEQLTEEDWQTIARTTGMLAEHRLWIDDKPAPSLAHIRAETLALKVRMAATAGAQLGLVMVDYVQLVQGKGANRYEQLRDVAYGLKGLAKEAGVPVLMLAQLNRGVEGRDQKRPKLSDLRDSGAIEEAADIVGMLYSEGYYDREFGMPYVLELQLEKNRNGERGECLWFFDGEHSLVGSLDEGAKIQYRRERAALRRGGSDDL